MRKTMMAAGIAAAAMGLPAANAGEGMWVPQQLPEIAGPLKPAGLKLDPKQLADLTGDPLGAVVSLGGCTAGFVSPQGLVATNHHCAYSAIQAASSVEHDYLEQGLLAATRADEIPAKGVTVQVVESVTDVTAKIREAADAQQDQGATDLYSPRQSSAAPP